MSKQVHLKTYGNDTTGLFPKLIFDELSSKLIIRTPKLDDNGRVIDNHFIDHSVSLTKTEINFEPMKLVDWTIIGNEGGWTPIFLGLSEESSSEEVTIEFRITREEELFDFFKLTYMFSEDTNQTIKDNVSLSLDREPIEGGSLDLLRVKLTLTTGVDGATGSGKVIFKYDNVQSAILEFTILS